MKREIFHYSIEEAAPYIDWSYLLHAWGLNGGDAIRSSADEIMRDARAMLDSLGDKHSTHAIFALCEARGDGDDIMIEGERFPMLRQQHALPNKPNLCLSDFVSPYGDKVGLFATTVDAAFGTEYHDDTYMHILAQTLADRLAEATASMMHMQVRKEKRLWGYAPDEELDIEGLNKEKYQGIRPAVGYPSLPDQSIIFDIDRLLKIEDIGITVTGSGAMLPHASVCGMMISHPAASYFAIGKIDRVQLQEYSVRRGKPVGEIEKFLTRNIG